MKRRIEINASRLVSIPFVKAHACGNDFLILEETVAGGDHAALARKLCSRNTSIGADGIEFIDRQPARRDNLEFFLRLFNADGSEAELSGNGTRCVAAWMAGFQKKATASRSSIFVLPAFRQAEIAYSGKPA